MLRFPSSPNVSADLVGLFREGLRLSRLAAGESAIIYADTLSNAHYPAAFLAAAKDLGAEAFQIIQPAIPHELSRGAGRAKPTALVSKAMQSADLVVDVTTGGMLYSDEQAAILAAGTRILRVREPHDCLLRLLPSEAVRARSIRGRERLQAARRLRVTSDEGTDLMMEKGERPVPIQYGMADEPGRWDHWPTGMVNTTAIEGSVEGKLVIGAASLIFPLERYTSEPMEVRFEGGIAVAIAGGREAVMLSDMLDQRNDPNCRRLAHIGWGTDHRARWEVLCQRGADGGGGAEARSLYGGVLLALGENRDLGGANAASLHIDIALRRARLELDGEMVVDSGRILDPALA